VRADGVEVTPPGLDENLGLGEAEYDLAVQQFVAEPGVEAFAAPFLPRAAGWNGRSEAERRADSVRVASIIVPIWTISLYFRV
jgi:hypothetical protein